MVAPLLLLLLFGIVEFGMMFHTQMQLNNMTREGARTAAVGALPTNVTTRVTSSGSLNTTGLTVTTQYRTYASGSWSSWATLGTSGTSNNAPSGAEIRVQAAYPYHLTVGALFAALVSDPTNQIETLHCTVMMRRE